MTNPSLIPVLAHKLPEFVRENYPNFEQYIRDYLAYLEQDENFLGIVNSWRTNMEPSLKVEPYIDAMLSDLGFVSGQNLAIDKSLLIHMLQDFYLSRGSPASFRFLFRMLFNADVEIRYPRDLMFVPSYAEYGERHFIFTSAANIENVDFSDLVLSTRANGGTMTGVTSRVRADIENIQMFHGSGVPYFQIEILRPTFEFLVGEAVTIHAGDITFTEFVKPVLKIEVDSPGSRYRKGDLIQVSGAKLNGHAIIGSTRKGGISGLVIESPGSGYAVGNLIIARSDDDGSGFSAIVSEVSGSGIANTEIINAGYNYETIPDIFANSTPPAQLRGVSSVIGAINTIEIENPFVDFESDGISISIISENGSGAVLTAKQVSRWETKDWADRKGFLEENSTLIDSDKVQQFSYTIVSPVSANQYDAFVKEYLHPVGYVRTSSYEIVSTLGLNITAEDTLISTEVPFLYASTLNLAFLSNSSIVLTEGISTDDGEEIVTNLNEYIITE